MIRMQAMIVLGLILLSLCGGVLAAEATLSQGSNMDAVLDALDARGQGLKDFSADVSLSTVDMRSGDASSQYGKVIFQDRGGHSRIRVSFDSRKLESGAVQKQRLDYLLDQGWLIDRDYQRKLEVKRQVLKPGQKMDLLKLGQGPFPLPIGQKKEDVKQQFEVSKVPPAPEDPKNTVHVRLVPKSGSQFAKQFRQIDVHVDLATNWPVRIDTLEKAGTARTTDLSNIKTNTGVGDDAFALPSIDGQGWNRREEPFE